MFTSRYVVKADCAGCECGCSDFGFGSCLPCGSSDSPEVERPGIDGPCYGVQCGEGMDETINGDSCICTESATVTVADVGCPAWTCSQQVNEQGDVYFAVCCPAGTYCGKTNSGSKKCIAFGAKQSGVPTGCTEPDELCDVSLYCEGAGFSSTETDYEIGGIAECAGQIECSTVTLQLPCYEDPPENVRTVQISMGNQTSGTVLQIRDIFSGFNEEAVEAQIQSWIPNTISKKEVEETIPSKISTFLKDIVGNIFAQATYTTTTELGFVNDSASGLEINNPTYVTASYSDTDGVNDLEGLFYWLTSEGTFPTQSPRYVDDDGPISDAQTVTAEDFGFMIRRTGGTWADAEIYVPAITVAGNYWFKAGDFGDNFYIYGPNGLPMVSITSMSMSIPTSDDIDISFDIEFLNENSSISSYEKVNDGEYDILAMAIDEYSFSTWDQYNIVDQVEEGIGINPDTVRTYFSENSIRDYREWTDTGLNWVIDLTPPEIDSLIISTLSDVELQVDWTAEDVGSGIAYVVGNLFTDYYGEDTSMDILYAGSGDAKTYTVPSFAESLIGLVEGDSLWESDWKASARGVSTYYGVTYGIQNSSLNFLMDRYRGTADNNEIDIICAGGDAGCYIYTVEGNVIYTPSISGGIAIADDATGTGFVMYSPIALSERDMESTSAYNSRSYIAVRFEEDEGGWQYNNNTEWINFNPIEGDILIADIVFGESVDEVIQEIGVNGMEYINIEESGGSLLSVYLTIFDQAGNFDILSDTYNTDAWLITKGGVVFSEDGTNIAISLLNLSSREYQGITYGLQSSDIQLWPNYWGSSKDAGEIRIYCGSDDRCTLVTLDGEIYDNINPEKGVAIVDNATGDGYIMYSPVDFDVRGDIISLKSGNSDHFIAVRYDEEEGWQYNNDSIWINFTPMEGDILVASVIFDPLGASKVESIGDSADFEDTDVTYGLRTSNLVFKLHQYNGLYNVCEIDIECPGGDDECYVTTTDGTTYSDLDIAAGMALTSYDVGSYCLSGSGYVMFSPVSLRSRGIDPYHSSSDSFVVVRYIDGEWRYSDNDGWIPFQPIKGDALVAWVRFYQLKAIEKIEIVSMDSWPGDLWYSPDSTGDSPTSSSSVFDSSEIDISTEILAGNVQYEEELYKLIHSTSITEGGKHNDSSLVLENIGILRNSAYLTYRAKANIEADDLEAEYVSAIGDTTFSGNASDYCSSEYCIVDSEYNLTIASGFSCDTRMLFMTSEDITIEPDLKNSNSTNACLFLSGGDITIEEGTYASEGETEPKYDVLEGFLIADGTINIETGDAGKSVKDGLQINGGTVAFGGTVKSIVITRDMKLADKLKYPIVAVHADVRYGKVALKFFGPEISIYKQEVGYKPY